MSLRRASLSVVLLCLGLSSACALRPRYGDVVASEAVARSAQTPAVTMRLLDASSGRPIPGARVLASRGRAQLSVVSNEEGLVTLPVSKALADENPLMEVVLPKGVKRYRFEEVRSEVPPAPPAATPVETAPPAEAAPGTGT
ncbi:hypothetical protein POL68_30300 [Stigmatella sp. ncwal1]|uniref:Carboxypeptidase regulatory-like domain-containing protein n=1 Tax=Stigmatella ashevillensis TaxID=2995309 RepID=A0ABT5DGY3_9BACT|nr:hypothetical protein [Stigmatella ashevillena]MDC0712791.1 hypothetical protein [Stigmatella ashevillena]